MAQANDVAESASVGGGGPAEGPSQVIGFVEKRIGQVIQGWACDVAAPEHPVRLTMYVDGQPVSEAVCDVARGDLEEAGLPRPDCGFEWKIPDQFMDGQRHVLGTRAPGGEPLPFAPGFQPARDPWADGPAEGRRRRRAVPRSALFDEAFYLDRYPEVRQELGRTGRDAWLHFLHVGAERGLNPNVLFDVGYYRDTNPDVAESDENPLLHYEHWGRSEGRQPHWLFSASEYFRLNPDLNPGLDALGHMLSHGLQENRTPHPLFDPAYYYAQSPDVERAGLSALGHFLRSGDREGRAPHPLFDPAYYQAQEIDADKAGADKGVLERYIRSGGVGNPHPLFDSAFYRGAHDVPENEPALLHYLAVGAGRGWDPHPAFDTAHYLRVCADPAARRNPLLHYVTQGRLLGVSPQPLFDPAFYAGQPSHQSWTGAALPRTGPRISVIVPVHNTPPAVLTECIESVRRQTYGNWELCLLDDGSRNPRTVAVLAGYRGSDPRIRVERSTANLHIARATNRAVLQATGEFVAFLDHDDLLEPEALAEVALAVQGDPTIDLLYTDEDKIDASGRRCEPYHKPDWSPEHLDSVMYVLHMLVVRKSVFWAVGGSRPERTGAQDYDLALRVARVARRVHHVPRILYHWRMMAGSAAGDMEAKPYALQAARSALEDAVASEGVEASVEDGLLPGTFRVRRSLASRPQATLLVFTNDSERTVPGRGRINLVRNFLQSILDKSTYDNHRIVVVDNGNSSEATRRLVRQAGGKILQYQVGKQFSYAHKANFATRSVKGEHLIYLNDDMEVISPDWIEALLEHSTRETVGGVGGRLLYPDGRIQHSGIVLGVNDTTGHAFWNLPRDVVGYNGYTHVIRNYSAVTGAVFATRRAVMEEVGGFDEALAIDYNDIDLCLRIGQTGRRIVFTPYCELYHFEGSTAVRTAQNPRESALFSERWASLIGRDPFYNPNLPRDRLGFG